MAVLLELDTTQLIREKLEHIKRKYPPTEVNRANGANAERYYEIKARYRNARS